MRIVGAILLLLLFAPTWSGEERLPLYSGTPTVLARRVPLFPDDPDRTRLGALTYLGGLQLRSRDPAFGGFSSLAVNGGNFTLLSDGGLVFHFRMGGDLVPHAPAFAALPAGPRTGWRKMDRDSESLTTDPATGRMWVGFENANAIWRYAPDFARGEASARPRRMRRWPKNSGPESMVRLTDGRFLVLSEDADAPGGGQRALCFDRDPTDPAARRWNFVFRAPGRYLPSDMAQVDARHLLVLVRDATLREGFTNLLLLVDLASIKPGATVRGRVLARLAWPTLHDNFEGVAVTHEGGRPIVWLVSDDNTPSWFQRTLLLKFRLDAAL